MAASNTIDLGRLALRPGDGRRLDFEVDPGELEYGGQSYATSHADPARIDVSRMAAGHALRLRFETRLQGPCMRCLADAAIDVHVDAREVDQPGGGAELESPYVHAGELDLGKWAHDALALALPAQLLCRADCAGLCPVCGESLNDAEPGAHDHPPEPDPRWEKLRELKLD
jgi:uncharacterized protein